MVSPNGEKTYDSAQGTGRRAEGARKGFYPVP